ncbi:MAG TPA: hypothetical protein VH206_22400 [Xanthobacteraceae bacterium]|nr:hypothetical protein [Xanthobacteraceae bacterium]
MSLIDVESKTAKVDSRRPLAKVFGEDGYSIDVKLSDDELAELRRLTTEAWLKVILKASPDEVDRFRELGIENYHRLAHLLDHANLWTTHARTFDKAQADVIGSFAMFDMLSHEFPESSIIGAMPPYGDLGRPRINWRLVRPGDGTDLGPIHADYWFDAVLDGWRDEPGPDVKLKIWVPIFLEEGSTGFAYAPGSHLRQYPFERVHIGNGLYKPNLAEAELDRPLQTLRTPPGTAVLFNYNLVHRGANTSRATQTRVSMELTMNIPRDRLAALYGNVGRYH